MEILDDKTTEAFIDRFFGYGNWTAPVWFIGMEEGGGGTIQEVRRRIETWKTRGSRDLEDLVEYHFAIGLTKHVGPRATLQPTWSKLVSVLLGMNGGPATSEHVREFQATKLGRRDGSTCLVELFPLPSPSLDAWIYASATTIPYLAARETYCTHVVRHRIAAIRERLTQHQPAAIVFLGLSYVHFWSQIAGTSLLPRPGDALALARTKHTTFIAAKHPVARGVTNAYFRSVGERIVEAVRTQEAY